MDNIFILFIILFGRYQTLTIEIEPFKSIMKNQVFGFYIKLVLFFSFMNLFQLNKNFSDASQKFVFMKKWLSSNKKRIISYFCVTHNNKFEQTCQI